MVQVIEEVGKKKCSKCGNKKSFAEFYKCSGAKDGHQSQCKACQKIHNEKHYQDNREKCLALGAEYRANNPEKIRTSNAKHRQEHPDYQKKWYREHQEEVNRKSREFSPHLKNIRNYWKTYKRNAERGKYPVEFLLTLEEFDRIVSKPCEYCGALPEYFLWGEERFVGGIDRIDNEIGYIFENCAPCCQQCNYAKSNQIVEVFLRHMERVVNFQREKDNEN